MLKDSISAGVRMGIGDKTVTIPLLKLMENVAKI